MKTGSITYNGKNSLELGVYTTGSGSFDAAELDVDKYEIPGRNGDLILSNNRYKNIEITYPAFIPKAFMDKVQNVRNWLRSSRIYARLEDTYDPDHYRLGIPTGVQSFSPEHRNDGANFEMTFDCKPQRFLKAGETPETVEPDVQTASGEIASFETDYVVPLSSAEVSLSPQQDLNGYDSPWPGGGGKNKFPILIGAESFGDNVNATHSNSNGTLVVNCTATNDSGVYSRGTGTLQPLIGGYSEPVTYSFDIKASAAGNVNVGYQGAGAKNVAATTSWQRVTINTTATGTNRAFVVYNRSGSALTVEVKDFMFQTGTIASANYEPYENMCPISGHTGAELIRTGKNLIWRDTTANIYNGGHLIPVTAGETLYFYGEWTGGSLIPRIYSTPNETNKNNYIASLATLSTATSGFVATRVVSVDGFLGVAYNGSVASYTVEKLMVSRTPITSADDYEAPQNDTYSVIFTDQGTVYGGTYDFVTGKLKMTMASVDLGTLTWTKGNRNNDDTGYVFSSNGISATISRDYQNINAICSAFAQKLPRYSLWESLAVGQFQVEPTGIIVFVADYSDAATFKTAMSGVQLVYELATPLEYTLSAQQIETLLGENNVWSDAGEITLTYAEPFTIENPTLFDARPLFTVTNPAEGDVITVNGQAITFVDGYTGTVYIDCETMNAFSGAANLNSIIEATDFPVLVPGTNIVTWTGAGECTMTPRWWEI